MAALTHYSYYLFQSLAMVIPAAWKTPFYPFLFSVLGTVVFTSLFFYLPIIPQSTPIEVLFPSLHQNCSCPGLQGLSGYFQGTVLSLLSFLSLQATGLSLPQPHLLYLDLKDFSS